MEFATNYAVSKKSNKIRYLSAFGPAAIELNLDDQTEETFDSKA
jgi:hypothetical protein